VTPPTVRTERLLLRTWRDEDLAPFAALNADADAMRWLGGPLARASSDALAARIRAAWRERGFGPFAVEVPGQAAFAGFVGLSVPDFEAPFTPCVEIGWRLARELWGRGYASEAARACLRFGFRELGLAEVVSFTASGNAASRRVMERIGMRRDPAGDFEHPKLAPGHPLRSHVLYRLPRPSWQEDAP
jgi:RimJ/RimL family protein N-acetyltransferase